MAVSSSSDTPFIYGQNFDDCVLYTLSQLAEVGHSGSQICPKQ